MCGRYGVLIYIILMLLIGCTHHCHMISGLCMTDFVDTRLVQVAIMTNQMLKNYIKYFYNSIPSDFLLFKRVLSALISYIYLLIYRVYDMIRLYF